MFKVAVIQQPPVVLDRTRSLDRAAAHIAEAAAAAHIAREACCSVIGSGTAMRDSDLPADFPERERLYADADEWINNGDSVVVAPGGAIAAGPMRKATGMLIAEIHPDAVAVARRRIDVAGHYARPDVFSASRQPRGAITGAILVSNARQQASSGFWRASAPRLRSARA